MDARSLSGLFDEAKSTIEYVHFTNTLLDVTVNMFALCTGVASQISSHTSRGHTGQAILTSVLPLMQQ